MNFRELARFFTRASLERPSTPLSGAALLAAFGAMPSASGTYVTPSTALQIAAVYACVRVIAETIGTLPVHVYRRLPRGRELVMPSEHSAARLLDIGPNDEMSPVDLFETMTGHVLLWGNAYSEVNRSPVDGSLQSIWPLRPDRTTPVRNSRNALVYESVDETGQPTRRRSDRILHIRGLSYDGLIGYTPITLARETLGMAKSTADYGARFFANDSRPGGVLQTDGQLSPDAINRLKTTWEAAHSAGAGQSHKVAVLEQGLKWQSVGMPNDDAQWLDTRKYTRSEIAGLFRVPAHLINDLEKATFSNIEQLGQEFATLCIAPWAVRIEKACNKTLFTEAERGQLFVRFNLGGLVRGDISSRYTAYATARQNGWMSANEIRELEDMNPVVNGDELLINGNMRPIEQAGERLAPAGSPPTTPPADTGEEPPQ